MDNEQQQTPWHQFSFENYRFEVRGGVTTESIGIQAAVRKSFYAQGIVAFEFQIGPLFLFFELFEGVK